MWTQVFFLKNEMQQLTSNINVGANFESIARLWVANTRHKFTNVITSAALWSLWKLRNEMCFQGVTWTGTKRVLLRIATMARRWMPLLNPETGRLVEVFAQQLENKAGLPPQLEWMPVMINSSSGLDQSGAQPLGSVVPSRPDVPCNGDEPEPMPQ
jgi:hypothetical protein